MICGRTVCAKRYRCSHILRVVDSPVGVDNRISVQNPKPDYLSFVDDNGWFWGCWPPVDAWLSRVVHVPEACEGLGTLFHHLEVVVPDDVRLKLRAALLGEV